MRCLIACFWKSAFWGFPWPSPIFIDLKVYLLAVPNTAIPMPNAEHAIMRDNS